MFVDAYAGDVSDDDVERFLLKVCGDSWIGMGVWLGVKIFVCYLYFG